MPRIFAIGDIHGCSNTFRKLLFEKIAIKKSDTIYCIGDYIDRGKDSKGVIDIILQLRTQHYRINTLKGNHEQMMLDSTEDEEAFKLWMANGGDATLRSFDVESINELPPVYLNFFKRTKYFIETKEYIFVHAGLNFELPNPFEDKESMLWIRNFRVDKKKLNGKLLIHGHTPVPATFILTQKPEGAVNIDGGCVYTHSGLGNLFAINLTEKKFIGIANCEAQAQ